MSRQRWPDSARVRWFGCVSNLSHEARSKRRKLHRTRAADSLESAATSSSRLAVVIVQHAAEALALLHSASILKVHRFWANEAISQALVVALGMIVLDEVLNSNPQRFLSKQ